MKKWILFGLILNLIGLALPVTPAWRNSAFNVGIGITIFMLGSCWGGIKK